MTGNETFDIVEHSHWSVMSLDLNLKSKNRGRIIREFNSDEWFGKDRYRNTHTWTLHVSQIEFAIEQSWDKIRGQQRSPRISDLYNGESAEMTCIVIAQGRRNRR